MKSLCLIPALLAFPTVTLAQARPDVTEILNCKGTNSWGSVEVHGKVTAKNVKIAGSEESMFFDFSRDIEGSLNIIFRDSSGHVTLEAVNLTLINPQSYYSNLAGSTDWVLEIPTQNIGNVSINSFIQKDFAFNNSTTGRLFGNSFSIEFSCKI